MEDSKEIKEKKPMKMSVTKTEGDKTTTINVEQIENGFLVTTCIDDYSDKNYNHSSKKVFCKENPLDVEEESDEEKTNKLSKGLNSMFNSLAKSSGDIEVD